ncbi:MAG TPA: RNase H1/viroplasmin domain-containing protein [Candidatus Binatia bacterium]
MAQKFYVVWSGRQTGVFTDWATTQRAVDKYAGARFKSFPTRAQVEHAFGRGGDASIPPKSAGRQKAGTLDSERSAAHPSHQVDVSIYCDGACEPVKEIGVRSCILLFAGH